MQLKSPKLGLPHFKRLYVSIGALVNGFLARCKEIIELDSCYLKGVFASKMLNAIERDANDNIYLKACIVVELEMKDSWS